MNRNRFFVLLAVAVLIVGAYLLLNAVGPKVGATAISAAPVGMGDLQLFEAEQNQSNSGSSSLSPRALEAWAARYTRQAKALGVDSGMSARALSAWAARYQTQAQTLYSGAGR